MLKLSYLFPIMRNLNKNKKLYHHQRLLTITLSFEARGSRSLINKVAFKSSYLFLTMYVLNTNKIYNLSHFIYLKHAKKHGIEAINQIRGGEEKGTKRKILVVQLIFCNMVYFKYDLRKSSQLNDLKQTQLATIPRSKFPPYYGKKLKDCCQHSQINNRHVTRPRGPQGKEVKLKQPKILSLITISSSRKMQCKIPNKLSILLTNQVKRITSFSAFPMRNKYLLQNLVLKSAGNVGTLVRSYSDYDVGTLNVKLTQPLIFHKRSLNHRPLPLEIKMYENMSPYHLIHTSPPSPSNPPKGG